MPEDSNVTEQTVQGEVAPEIQSKALKDIQETRTAYERQMKTRHEQLFEVWEAYSTFREPVEENWSTSFRINKANEIIEKIVPELTARDPRWIVSTRDVNAFLDTSDVAQMKQELDTAASVGMVQSPEEIDQFKNKIQEGKREKISEMAQAVQDYLTFIFDEYRLMDTFELWAKNMVIDGKSYARVHYKYETSNVPTLKRADAKDPSRKITAVDREISGEYPTVEIIDWTEILYDPRYKEMKDRPAHILYREGVRLADILRDKQQYMNVDKLEQITALQCAQDGMAEYKSMISTIVGGTVTSVNAPIDQNALCLSIYYGWFSPTPENKASEEKVYKIVTVNDLLVIQMQEIAEIPLEEVKCFPNPKLAYAWGFVEPIIGLQEELNFKKNSASEYINKALYRQRVWSSKSGIDPRDLNKQIIPTNKNAQEALANIPEVPFQSIPPEYFSESQDFERQIQGLTHTIDTTAPRGQNALTDFASGIRLQFHEANKVTATVRKRFERGLERIAYKLLAATFENMENNIVFKKQGTEEYWEINKELLRDALRKYKIRVETSSSSFSNIENRREEAIAYSNILGNIDERLAASGSPSRVDWKEVAKDISDTFEKREADRFVTTNLNQMAQEVAGPAGAPGVPGAIKAPPPAETDAEKAVTNVLGGVGQ